MLDLQEFITHVNEEHLIADGQRVLLAVSGGRDSVTLLDLMCRAGFDVGIAHCNFHLRPGDCDRDEAFVRRLASHLSLPCHVAQFDTKAYAASQGLSDEEAARNLRYGFFDEVCKTESYALTATAHHRDDAVETFFINLLRGAGIGGLHGMPQRNGNVVRPLLCYGRDEIDAYVADRGLAYVDDYTNAQTLYLRNRIRHQLLPLLHEISPSFDAVMMNNMSHLADADIIYRLAIDRIKEVLLVKSGDCYIIDIEKLKSYEPIQTVLFELLRPYGFNSAICRQVASSLDAQSGKQFFSDTWCLLKDREHLVVSPVKEQSDECHLVFEDSCISLPQMRLTVEVAAYDGSPLHLTREEACFDRVGLHFPLMLRHWRKGDRFRPFGMEGSRLVSDLFTDLKLSLFEKEKVWLLCDGDEEGTVLWVVGYRASHNAIVSAGTREMVKVRVL